MVSICINCSALDRLVSSGVFTFVLEQKSENCITTVASMHNPDLQYGCSPENIRDPPR